MSKENRGFDLEDRLIAFAVMIVQCDLIKGGIKSIGENSEVISIVAASIKTATEKNKKLHTSTFLVRYSIFNSI